MSFWITVASFAAVSSLVAAIAVFVYDGFFRYRVELSERLSEAFDQGPSSAGATSPVFRDLRKLAKRTAAQTNWRDRIQIDLQQSGIPLTTWQWLGLCTVIPILATLLGASKLVSPWLMVPVGLAGAVAPLLYLVWRRRVRVQRLSSQLPRAFDMMSRAVRAGQTVPAAMRIVSEDLDPPIAQEFAHCYEQQNLGIQPEVTFRDLAKRCGVMELQIFVVALLVQNRTGGNLADLLDNLASIVRKRILFKARVKALTGEGRMQAAVLTVLPIVALIALMVLSPDYVSVLFDRPWLLATAGGAQLLGIVWIRSIVNFDP